MPLDPNQSTDDMHREMWESYKSSGKIGDTRPRNDAHARRIISAIIFSAQRRRKSEQRRA